MSKVEKNIIIPADCIANVFGQYDSNVKKIERAMNVTLIVRGDELKIIGEEGAVERTIDIMDSLVNLAKRGNDIT